MGVIFDNSKETQRDKMKTEAQILPILFAITLIESDVKIRCWALLVPFQQQTLSKHAIATKYAATFNTKLSRNEKGLIM